MISVQQILDSAEHVANGLLWGFRACADRDEPLSEVQQASMIANQMIAFAHTLSAAKGEIAENCERQPSYALRQQVFERDEFRCVKCGSTENLHVDHVIPWSKGGPTVIGNLQTLCQSCNLEKGVQAILYVGPVAEGAPEEEGLAQDADS